MLEKQPPIYKILDFVRRRSLAVIVACVAITALFGVALINIRVDPDLESLLPDDEEITELMTRNGGENSDQNYFAFAVEAPERSLPGDRKVRAVTGNQNRDHSLQSYHLHKKRDTPRGRANVQRRQGACNRGRS